MVCSTDCPGFVIAIHYKEVTIFTVHFKKSAIITYNNCIDLLKSRFCETFIINKSTINTDQRPGRQFGWLRYLYFSVHTVFSCIIFSLSYTNVWKFFVFTIQAILFMFMEVIMINLYFPFVLLHVTTIVYSLWPKSVKKVARAQQI